VRLIARKPHRTTLLREPLPYRSSCRNSSTPLVNPVKVALKGLSLLAINPHRGSLRVPWLASLACMMVLAVGLSAFGQTPAQPAQPDQQPVTPAQPGQQPTTPAQPATPDLQQPATPTQPLTAVPANPAPAASAQTQTAPAQQISTPVAAPAPSAPAKAKLAESGPATDQQGGGITEEELKQLLVGKTFYLRGGYLDDSLSFNEHGKLASHSPVGSYTLSMVQIDKVHLSKHKVELDGLRYGLHFSSQLAFEDPTTAFDKVRVTPKKKVLHISIDRESVVKPKKDRVKESKKQGKPAIAPSVAGPAPAPVVSPTGTETPATQTASTAAEPEHGVEEPDTDQAKAEIAAAKPEERPADPDSVTSTTSPAHATMLLKQALDAMFAPGLDDRMMAAMPDFWKLYYKAVSEKADYRPTDPAVLRQSTVNKKARLLSTFEPDSNQFAQDNGVAGMALYHTVIGPDGVPGEIAVARPIGFGLDENAVKAIRAAKFEPAEKDGKPVPVLLDLVVQFRIYSKRTNVKETPAPEDASKPAEPVLPGPYSVQRPPAQPQSAQQ
jgi:TonB family protein